MAGAYYPSAEPSASDWRLLVTDRIFGVFSPDTSIDTMSTLWRLAANPSTAVDALITAVPVRGPSSVESFAIVAVGRSTTIVVRGSGCADVCIAGRIRRVDPRGSLPWFAAELTGVDRFALGPLERSPGDLQPTPDDLRIEGGVVFGPWLGWTGQPVSAPVPVQPAAGAAPRSGPVGVGAAIRSVPTPGTALRRPPADVLVADSGAAGDTARSLDLGRRDAALNRTRREPPPTAPTPETAASACIRVGDRPIQRVDAPVYVGRQPRSPRVTGPTLPRLIRVESPSREVSATHVELRPTLDGVVLTDLESTNGTVVQQPGRGVRRLRSGESIPVAPGTLVDIGDGNVIEILPWR